jgi:hypothetical protein
MPLRRSLDCPHCRKVGHTAKVILPGAKVRCCFCQRAFRFTPGENAPEESGRISGEVEIGRLREVFMTDGESARVVKDDVPSGRYGGVTNQPFTANPLAPAAQRSKNVLIGGKPVRFDAPRKYMSVVLVFFLMTVGYGSVMGLHEVMVYLERLGRTNDTNKKAKYERESSPAAKTAPKTQGVIRAELETLVATPPAPRTVAGEPLRIDDLEVCVTEAREGIFDHFHTERRLLITVRMANLSKGNAKYPCWSQPANGLILRDQTPNLNRYSPTGREAQSERIMKPGEVISDVLVFLPMPQFFVGLDLDLPLWGGIKRFQFHIPLEFVQRDR